MSIGTSPPSAVRTRVALFVTGSALLALAGCSNNKYPDTLRYGVRTDLMVIKTPEVDPTHLDPPGDLNLWLASLKGRGATVLNPTDLPAGQRGELDKALQKYFGTPAHPRVEGLSADVVTALKLETDPEAIALLRDEPDAFKKHRWPYLEEGSRLFRRHCLHCHGVTGNGQGPTAAWVNPHPRDYRRGIFKFTSSKQPTGTRKARREDLLRTVRQGIEGTSMPAFGAQSGSQFGVLSEDELNHLVSYVIHLSLRGQTEWEALDPLLRNAPLEDDSGTELSIDDYAAARLQVLAGYWKDDQKPDDVIVPERGKALEGDELHASIRRGFALFTTGEAKCYQCHRDFGRRDTFKYDSWGTIARPVDMTQGIYRGGRRPVDLYWRVHGGINGAGMPAFGDSIKPEQIWDVVNFLQALPYEQMLPDDIRAQVYPKANVPAEAGGQAAAAAPPPGARPQAQE